ncbi:hypothetical protein H5V45_09190 [Nocardioides sp. KIGAM211]|uniref:Uncharacterized protein n=1 Tax=Nocardioides luti TaxID=2761101 RepID=A0A7X0RFS4_9ACTN|nr:hypothetical protein [Nocardioides luti]MBB6627496.1 hypothetical protein [Nocardioides luti]
MTITIELYDMGSTDPHIFEAEESSTIAEAVKLKSAEVLVLVDEGDEVDGDVDLVELDRRTTVGEASRGHSRLTLLRNPAARVTVNVHYAGVSKALQVRSTTRIRRIRKLAIAALGVDPERATDTALRLPGSDVDLTPKSPIGAYLGKGQRQIDLDLVHKDRPQG